MKKMLCLGLLSLVLVSTASAKLTKASSWNAIDNASDVFVSYSWIGAGPIAVTVNELCVDGDVLTAQKTTKQCVEWGVLSQCTTGDNGECPCVKYVNVPVETPINHAYERCVEWGVLSQCTTGDNGECPCLKWDRGYEDYPLTWKAEVYVYSNDKTGDTKTLFLKDYTIPQCK